MSCGVGFVMIKKFLLLLFSILLMSSFVSANDPTIFLVDTFEDGDLLNPTWTKGGNMAVTSNGNMEGAKEGYSGTTSAYNYVSFNNSGTGYYNVSFIARMPTTASEKLWYFAWTGASPSVVHGAAVALGDGYVTCFNASTDKNVLAISSNTNYNVNYILNGSDGKFKLYVDGVYYGLFVNRGTMTGGYKGISIVPDNTNEDGYIDNLIVRNATRTSLEDVSVYMWDSVEFFGYNDSEVRLNYSVFVFNDGGIDFNSAILDLDDTFDNGSTINIDLIAGSSFTQSFINITQKIVGDVQLNLSAPIIRHDTGGAYNMSGIGVPLRVYIPKLATESALISCIKLLGSGCGVIIESGCAAVFTG